MKTIICSNGGRYTNYNDYLKSNHWKNKRKAFFKVNKRECEHCGKTEKLHVHHKTYARVGNEKLTDLMCLCEYCHNKEHKKLKQIKENRKNGRKKAKVTKIRNKSKKKKSKKKYKPPKHAPQKKLEDLSQYKL